MSRYLMIPVRGAVGCLLLAVLAAQPASAQFRVNPALLENQPALTTAGIARPVNVGVPQFGPAYGQRWGGGWGGGGWGPWGPWGGMTPAYGVLSGAAELTQARSQALVTVQQSRLLNQQALQSQIDTRKALIEQAAWEQAMRPTPEQIREQNRQLAVRRSLNDPPLTDIISGDALNSLMEEARRNQLAGVPGPLVPVDPDTLTHINVTTGTTNNGSAVTRDTESLKWPLPLQAPRWKDLREIINTTMSNATLEARGSGIQFETDKRLNDAIKQLDKEVDAAVADLTPTEFVQSRRFVRQLQDSRRTLGDPAASNYLTGKFAARGSHVAELFQNMQSSGLRFAPARPGSESYYRSLHNSMVAFVGSQAMLTAQAQRPPQGYPGQGPGPGPGPQPPPPR